MVTLADGFHVSSWTITLDSFGYSYFSLVCQQTLPVQAKNASALEVVKARTPAPITTPISVLYMAYPPFSLPMRGNAKPVALVLKKQEARSEEHTSELQS